MTFENVLQRIVDSTLIDCDRNKNHRIELPVTRTANGVSVTVPELDIYTMVVVELER